MRTSQESAKLGKAVKQEADARLEVEGSRRQVGAMGAAIAEWGGLKESHAVIAVRGAQQPGNTYSKQLLLEEFMEGESRRELLAYMA